MTQNTSHIQAGSPRHVAVVMDLNYALPWHQDCYQGIMRYGREHGWKLHADHYVAGMEGGIDAPPYDGVVGRIPREISKVIRGYGVPVSNLARFLAVDDPDWVVDQPGVFVDRIAAFRMAAEHLAQVGYRRLGLLTLDAYDVEKQVGATRQACEEHGMQWNEPLLLPTTDNETREQYLEKATAIKRWLSGLEKPAGLLTGTVMQARQAAHIAMELGFKVPEEVGIVSRLDDRSALVSSSPTISAVDYDYFEQGYEAAAVLDRLMNREEARPAQRWMEPSELVVRDSTDVFLCEDELVSEAMRYIAAHVREDLSVSTLAEAMHVSPKTLHRRFDEALGRRPLQEIIGSGWTTSSAFCAKPKSLSPRSRGLRVLDGEPLHTFFKREVGVPPGVYRKQANRI